MFLDPFRLVTALNSPDPVPILVGLVPLQKLTEVEEGSQEKEQRSERDRTKVFPHSRLQFLPLLDR